jgi:hypothetical protein
MTVPAHIADILSRLGRIEGKVDAFIKQMEAHDGRTTDIEIRTRRMENRQHWYSGAGAVFGAILGAVGVHVKI